MRTGGSTDASTSYRTGTAVLTYSLIGYLFYCFMTGGWRGSVQAPPDGAHRNRSVRRRATAGRGRVITRFPDRTTTSRPGTGPHRSTPPQTTRSGTGCREPANVRSTRLCTPWPPSRCETPPRAGPTSTVRKADGKTSMGAMRALKRRLSNIIYRTMLDDAVAHAATG